MNRSWRTFHYMVAKASEKTLSTNAEAVRVPASLLLDRGLSSSAKLIRIALRPGDDAGTARPAPVERRTGLSRKTVLKGLAELAASQWSRSPAAGGEGSDIEASPPDVSASTPGATVCIPLDLVADRRVGVRARLLYGQLQLTPNFQFPNGRFTYAGLSGLAGVSLHPVRRAVRDLVETGWIRIAQRNRLVPVTFSLRNPVADRRREEVDRVRRRLEASPFLGEALMRAYLSLLVASEDFEDDAAPGFLVNPWTDERMELDRFYPPDVAFEFNGPQHYGATERFSEETAARQRGRDYMKLGICTDRGIRLVVVHPEDLSLERMRRLIGPLLPKRDLTGHEPVLAYLEGVGRRYRLAARRGRRLERAARGSDADPIAERSDAERAARRSDAARFGP